MLRLSILLLAAFFLASLAAGGACSKEGRSRVGVTERQQDRNEAEDDSDIPVPDGTFEDALGDRQPTIVSDNSQSGDEECSAPVGMVCDDTWIENGTLESGPTLIVKLCKAIDQVDVDRVGDYLETLDDRKKTLQFFIGMSKSDDYRRNLQALIPDIQNLIGTDYYGSFLNVEYPVNMCIDAEGNTIVHRFVDGYLRVNSEEQTSRSWEQMFKLLIHHKFDPCQENNAGISPLVFAVLFDLENCVRDMLHLDVPDQELNAIVDVCRMREHENASLVIVRDKLAGGGMYLWSSESSSDQR